MKTSTLVSNLFRKASRKYRRRHQPHSRLPALERLESRELLTATMAWDGDVLQITGSDDNDFVAVQQDQQGLRVYTEDAVFAEYEGRSLDTASSVSVAGLGGNDILFSYQTDVPVNLRGDDGNDFLYSDTANDVLEGGQGFNWIQNGNTQVTSDDAFGIEGLDLTVTPQLDEDGRIGLQVDATGDMDLAGVPVAVTGGGTVTEDGIAVAVTGAITNWDDAFGIDALDLNNTSLTVSAGTDVNDGDGYRVDVSSNLHVSGTDIGIDGSVEVQEEITTAAFTGTVANWDDAFGITGLDLTDAVLTGSGSIDADDNQNLSLGVNADMLVENTVIEITGNVDLTAFRTDVALHGSVDNWDDAFGIVGLDLADSELNVTAYTDHQGDYSLGVDVLADMHVEDTAIEVSGSVDIEPNQIDAVFSGSVDNWDDAFGIVGLDLKNSELNVTASSDREANYDLHIDLLGEMQVDDVDIDVSGSVDITPDMIDAVFNGSVGNWDDAFGIDGLDLLDSDVDVVAFSNRNDDYDLRIDLTGDMDIQGTKARVAGSVNVEPDRVEGTLTGSVAANWANAFGIAGLTLKDAQLGINAVHDENEGNSLGVDLNAGMDLAGTDIAVTGEVDFNEDGISGSLTGVIAGTWTSAFGIGPLHLHDTTISVSGSRTAAGSELSLGVTAGMNVLGTDLGISGTVEVTPEEVRTTLTGSVSGEWMDAFGIPGLDLRDTDLTIGGGSDSAGLDIDLDTDLKLFGGYIDMIGDLDISPSGVDISFSPPTSLGFTDLLGIPGFSLDDADLTLTAGTGGLEVAIGSSMDMGNIDVDFEGVFAVSRTGVAASLTGRVAEWDNAFEVPGLNLNDVVLTLGAESGVGGASMYIGVGAGIEIGRSEVDVAGLVGFGATGWEVAFRGSIDSLSGYDVIDFANTMNQAADPNAATIPDGSLGDLELRAAYINFAPYGGNEALGIEDGFGIGAAFYDDGKLLGSGEFIVDMANGVFEAGLDIPELNLGPVELSDVLVDIRLAPTDSHYHVAGTAELLGAEVSLEGKISSNSFSLQGSAAVDLEGLSASVQFIVDQNGIRFVATSGGGAINAVKDNLTSGIRTVANVAQTAIDTAQDGVDAARRGVKGLEAELAEARADAQKAIDKIKSDIKKAKAVVDSALSSRNYWYNQRKVRYNAWKSAKRATSRAVWYKKPYYKGIEASKYASYVYAAGRYSAQVVVYNAANVAYNAVRNAAGWALDVAGVEANPEVLRIKALLAAANLGLDAAELVLDGVEHANAGVLQTLNLIDSVRVNRITIAGNVSDFKNSGLRVTLDYSIGGRSHLLTLDASADNLVEQLGKKLLAAVV